MALQTSGTISINDLKVEFNDTYPSSMNEFYRGGALVPNITANNAVPTSGTIALNNFYGATAQAITFNLGSDVTDASISTYYYASSIVSYVPTGGAAISVTGGQYRYYDSSTSTWSGFTSSSGTFLPTYTQVEVRVVSSSSYGVTTTVTLTIGGVSDSFSVTTSAVDTCPDTPSFSNWTGVELNTFKYRAATITGINTSTVATAGSGDLVSLNATNWYSSVTVSNGTTLYLGTTSSGSYSTSVTASVSFACGTTGSFTVTTRAADAIPDAFDSQFSDITNATPGQYYVQSAYITGIETTVTATAGSGDQVSLNQVNWYSSVSVSNGTTIYLRTQASSSYSTTVTASVSIGGVTGDFTVTTQAADTSPDQFFFTDETLVFRNTTKFSNTITVSGLSSGVSVSVSVSGGSYSKNGGSYTTGSTTAINGDTFSVSVTSSGSYNTASSVTLTIGDKNDTYTVTTLPQVSSSHNFPSSGANSATSYASYNSQINSATASSRLSASLSASSSSLSLSFSIDAVLGSGGVNNVEIDRAYSATVSGPIASYYLSLSGGTPSLGGDPSYNVATVSNVTQLSYFNTTKQVPASDSGSVWINCPSISWIDIGAYSAGSITYTIGLTVTDIEGTSFTIFSGSTITANAFTGWTN